MGTSELVSALETASWPVLVVDRDGTVLHANVAAAAAFGALMREAPLQLSAVLPGGEPLADRFFADLERSLAATASLRTLVAGQSTEFYVAGCMHESPGGRQYVLQFLAPPPPQAAGETTFFQKTKLDCALQLARTVALDFNNALTSILGHTSLVLGGLPSDSPWRRSLLEVEKSASRAAEIAADLGTFSQQEKPSRVQVDGNVNALLERTVELFQKEAGPAAPGWTTQYERQLFQTRFEEAKLQQAFIKILENALDAAAPRGRIQVVTRNIELAAPTQDRNVQLPAGAYVCVEVTDSGPGIAPENLARVFEPFFTTKGSPHRGIGLALAYGIITNHGGRIAISSNPGAGTSVRVYLPAELRVLTHAPAANADLAGTQTVLVVDDEDLILTMAQTVLSSYGYKVCVANGGQQALDLLSASRERIDLLLTDLVMPGMSGRELTEHVQAFCPQTRILRMSGYVWPAGQKPEPAYLQKPFTSQDLLQKVKQALA